MPVIGVINDWPLWVQILASAGVAFMWLTILTWFINLFKREPKPSPAGETQTQTESPGAIQQKQTAGGDAYQAGGDINITQELGPKKRSRFFTETDSMILAMKPYAGTTFDLIAESDLESKDLAAYINTLLTKSGWISGWSASRTGDPSKHGVLLSWGGEHHEAMQSLMALLNSIGVEAQRVPFKKTGENMAPEIYVKSNPENK